jgi:hypothetical protein
LGDVHSISLLVRSSVAGLKFGCALRDAAGTRSLCKLCTIPSTAWTLIQLPNLPLWDAGATWNVQPGNLGYLLSITLAAGSTYTAAAADVWQAGTFLAPPLMSNFAASAVNSTFDIAFCQHQPGSQCETLIDCPFTGRNGNLEACQRYFTKSWVYGIKPGTAGANGQVLFYQPAGSPNQLYVPFKRTMAINPTVTGYSNASGTGNTVRDISASVDKTITGSVGVGDAGFGGFTITSPNAGAWIGNFQYTADTGW